MAKPVYNEATKQWTISYQPKDENGDPVGREQTFTGASLEEVTEKLSAAHENASVQYYKERKARKFEDMIDVDPAQPLRKYEGKPLSAAELIALQKQLNDPAGLTTAFRKMIEAEFGAPIETIRERLQWTEFQERDNLMDQAVTAFLQDHPEYYNHNRNRDDMSTWLEKRGLPVTRKNLESAYQALKDDLIARPAIQPANASVSATPAASSSTPAASTEPSSTTGNSSAATTHAPGNSEEPVVVRTTSHSSSGVGRSQATVLPANAANPGGAVDAIEVTAQEIADMPSAVYAQRMRDPKFVAAVEKLYARK